MKKLLSILLAVIMLFTVAVSLTACGGEEKTDEKKDNTASTDEKEENPDFSGVIAALGDVQNYKIEGISATGWTFSGGLIDGAEMDEEEATAVLESCGGVLQLIFIDGSNANLINGEKVIEGTYELISDNMVVKATFPGYEYYGMITVIDETQVLILLNKKAPDVALYMTVIDEH